MKRTTTHQRTRLCLTHGLIVLSVLLGCVGTSSPVWAQLPATDPAVQNQFLLLRSGTGSNAGDFDIFTTSGNPDTPRDDNLLISGSATTVATLRILTDNAGQPLATPSDVPIIGGGSPVAGGTGDTLFLVVASSRDPDNAGFTTVWQTQPPVNNLAGGIHITQSLRLLRHVVQIRYDVQNNDVVPRTIGFALTLDNSPNDDTLAPPGPQVDTWVVPGFPPIRTERTFSRVDMPSQLFAIGDVSDPVRLTYHLLRGSPIPIPPDLFQIVTDPAGAGLPFAYLTDNRRDARVLPGANLVWNPVRFAPKEKRSFITFFGLGYASAELTPPYVLAAQSPIQLQTRVGDDPTTPQVEINHIDPNPFAIRGFVYNTSLVALNNVNLILTLPPGLQLAPGETPVKTIPTARPLQDAEVEWRVFANGVASGTLTYSVTASVANSIPKTLTRIVNVPRLAQSIGLIVQPGIQMVTFPYTFAKPDAADVFNFVNQQGGTVVVPFQLARYNPTLNKYEFYPADFSNLETGRAYWIRIAPPVGETVTLQLNGATPVSSTDPFLIPLKGSGSGWNMIGSPFLHPEFIGSMQLIVNNSEIVDFEQAVQRGLVRNILFFYDPVINNYRFDSAQARRLEPGVGYWIRALRDVLLVVPPATVSNSIQLQRVLTEQRSSVSTFQRSSVSAGAWQLQISAVTAEGQDPDNFIGTDPGAQDDFDLQDVEEPPPLELPVTVYFPHPDWGGNAGKFARDLRSSSARTHTWDMTVETNLKAAAPVTLNFPDLSELPRSLRVSLVDLSTNQTVALRSRRAYTFPTPAGPAVRQFRIIVDATGRGGTLRFTNIAFNRTRDNAGVVTFTVTKSARVECVLLSATGKLVRVLASNLSAAPGLNTLTFDGKSQRGAALGRGVYILRFTATSEDEETTGAVKVVNLK